MDKYEIHIPPKEFQKLAPEYIRPPEEFTTPIDTYQEHITSKRKKYITISKEIYSNIKDFYNVMDNVLSGGGSFKQLKKGLIIEENSDNKEDL